MTSVYTNNPAVNKDLKKKFTKTFDLSQIAEDPMDSYLDTLNLWKKRIARDGSSLFRAVAEQVNIQYLIIKISLTIVLKYFYLRFILVKCTMKE